MALGSWPFENRVERERGGGDNDECNVNINGGKVVMIWKRQRPALDQK